MTDTLLSREEAFESLLAPYATKASESRGRLVPEPPSATRTSFQRDRDRIIHAGAFRKLRNKTQVFIESEGDYYRTRLTHSLEVAQIARVLAHALGLNEDLTETIALAHDLGHTCFGHAGEQALDAAMKPWGGFDHNEQTFRILTNLERRYIGFNGLNLTWETLEGVAKHNGPLTAEGPGQLSPTVAAFQEVWDLEVGSFAGPEAQIAAAADDIAYNTHDVDDGYRAGFFSLQDVGSLPLFGPILEDTRRHHPDVEDDRLMHAVVRQVIGTMVTDLLDSTRAALTTLRPMTAADIRHARQPLAKFSFGMRQHEEVIRAFLQGRVYRHPRVEEACAEADRIVRGLFTRFREDPAALPTDWAARSKAAEIAGGESARMRVVADYIAGMTDRFARKEDRRLIGSL